MSIGELLSSNNYYLGLASWYYYSETEPELNDTGTEYKGNYWRYVDGKPTVWTYSEEE